jgi:hypothetical protein
MFFIQNLMKIPWLMESGDDFRHSLFFLMKSYHHKVVFFDNPNQFIDSLEKDYVSSGKKENVLVIGINCKYEGHSLESIRDGNGAIDLMGKIRSSDFGKGVPILITSSMLCYDSCRENICKYIHQDRLVNYLIKPFFGDQLIHCLDKLVAG